MITIKNLSKTFGKETALKNISLKISKDQTTVVLGPSGSGKSTLLRCMKFLETCDKGAIFIDQDEIKSASDPLLEKIGMVFQSFNLFPHFSVMQNLTYAPSLKEKYQHDKTNEAANNLLKQFALLNKAEAKPRELSGGQKQRVAIARALMMNPEVLLFDEPTSALDQETVFELIKTLKNLKNDMAIFIVTHEIRFAKALADRIIFMDHGQILCDQKAEEFFKEPESYRAKLFMEQEGF